LGGFNLYRYSDNSPVLLRDPSGNQPLMDPAAASELYDYLYALAIEYFGPTYQELAGTAAVWAGLHPDAFQTALDVAQAAAEDALNVETPISTLGDLIWASIVHPQEVIDPFTDFLKLVKRSRARRVRGGSVCIIHRSA
jgi:hypothetical protein